MESRDLGETHRLFFFREALAQSGADRQGGRINPPPPPDRPRYEKCPDRARVNPISGRVVVFIHTSGFS